MAIVVQHTPYDAIFNMATQAGQADAAKQAQAQRDKEQLMGMQIEAQQRSQQFAVQAEQQARAEEMQYQTMLLQAKRQIDMQVEATNYARQKQQLTQTLNMIRDSDDIDEEEKDKFRIQVMARYAGVGSDLNVAAFEKTSSMENFFTKGAYKSKVAEDIQEQFDKGLIDESTALRAASNYDVKIDTKSPETKLAEQADEAVKRYERIDDLIYSAFKPDSKGRPRDPDTEKVIKPNDPRYEYYKTLNIQLKAAKGELDRFHGTGTRKVFNEALQKSQSLQKMAQIYGVDATFEKWNEQFGGGEKKESDYSGLREFYDLYSGSPWGILKTAKRLTGKNNANSNSPNNG